MADWQSVGFMHGVMNTDNFSILGLTLDYGPYGFMEAYEPGHICNHSDQGGRYAFDQQPAIGLWNCYALANALAGIVEPAQLEAAITTYVPTLRETFLERTRAKLGLARAEPEDDELGMDLRTAMAAAKSDFTRTFRMLADIQQPRGAATSPSAEPTEAAALDRPLRTPPRARNAPRCRTRGGHERRQPADRPAQSPRAGGHRCLRGRRRRTGPPSPRRAAPAVQRRPRGRGLRPPGPGRTSRRSW